MGTAETAAQTLLSMARAISMGDFQTLQGLWHPEACEFAPNTPVAVGRAEILFRARSLFEKWTHDMTIRCEEVHVAGGWAFASGSLTLRSVSRRGNKSGLLAGQFLAVLTNRGDGHWLIYRYCYNSCVPLASERSSP